ncbi:MAG: protein-tyrosine kinase [Desulforhopalus sp.]|jgi:protein-tyrosine kinase
MGKFSTTLEKGEHQARNTENLDDNWLEPEKVEAIEQKDSTFPPESTVDAPSKPWNARLFKATNKDISLPEIFKVLRTRILYPQQTKQPIKTVMITSAVPSEGKSFVTANLGISLAQGMDQHSLLIDCDLRRPSLAGLLGISNTSGLVDYLRDDTPLSTVIQKTSINKLSVLPSGRPPLNPAELLSSAKMKSLEDELSQRYDDRIIIFDTPPIMVAAESSVLAGLVDAVILVVREGMSKKADIQKAIDTIGKKKILGMVYNDQKSNIFDKSYSKKYSYYQHDE